MRMSDGVFQLEHGTPVHSDVMMLVRGQKSQAVRLAEISWNEKEATVTMVTLMGVMWRKNLCGCVMVRSRWYIGEM